MFKAAPATESCRSGFPPCLPRVYTLLALMFTETLHKETENCWDIVIDWGGLLQNPEFSVLVMRPGPKHASLPLCSMGMITSYYK